ncbi:MAG: mechanosensitive ion channel family protein [Elusimicrobiota bacterium]|jgi:small-conductance mechanosensitive channel/CRP-like cAMP-binding protein
MSISESLNAVFSPALLWFFPIVLTAILLLALAAPKSRRRLTTAALLVLSSAAGLLSAALLHRLGLGPETGFFRLVHGASCLLLAWAAINASAVLIFDLAFAALRLPLPALLQDLIRAMAYIGAALTVLSHEGANLNGILATSAVVTAVVAFSLQDTLGNVMGGMVLHLENTLSPGDWVRVGDEEGMVREIRWRQTTLETGAGNTIVIPNSDLMKGKFTVLGRNRSQPGRRLMQVAFNVYYDRLPNEVIAASEAALREGPPPDVAAVPAPWCVLSGFNDQYAVYAVNYWLTDLARPGGTDSDVRVRIYYGLARAGIKISVPNRSIIVNQDDAAVQARYLNSETARRVAAVRRLDIFQTLTDNEVRTLAGRLKPTPFARDEAMTRQGAQADWLFIIYEGEAEVRLHAKQGSAYQAVARLKPGDLLGEMGLIADEPRSATVVALTDVGCYRLDRDSFKDVLVRRPEIAESISLTLARRKIELDTAREGLREEVGRQRLQSAQGDLLSRIRGIFSLR